MTSLAGALLAEAQRLVEPLVVAGRVDSGAEMLLGLVGQSADAAGDPGLAAALTDLSQTAAALTALQDNDLDSWSGLAAVADAARKATTALAALEQAVSDPGLAHRLEGLGVDLTGQLTGVYLRRFHSRLFRLVAVLTLISPAEFHAPQPPVMDGGTVVRRTWFRDELHFDRIDPLLNQPWPTLRAVYFPNDLASAADAHASAALLFPMIGALLDTVHLPWSFDRRELNPPPPDDTTSTDPSAGDGDADTGGVSDQGNLPDPPPDPDPVDLTPFYLGFVPRLTVRIPQLQADGSLAGTFLGVAIESWSAAHPGNTPGLVVELTGALDWTATSGDWAVGVASKGDVPAFVIGPDGLSLGQGVSGADASVTVTAARQPPPGGAAAFVLGSPDGSRLEFGSVKAGLDLTLATSGLDLAIALAASSGKLVIAPGDADGFLAMMLPSDGLTAAFDVGMIVSASRGVELNGGAGLQVSRPAHISLGPVGSVDALVASVTVGGNGLHVGVGAGLTLHLGPIDISVDHVGISSTVTFPDGGGNLGALDVTTGFAGPTELGLSLTVDAGPVTGGGALVFDPDRGLYAGEMQLQFEQIAVRAVGLLTTSRSGYSLLVLVSAEFPPVQLGLGFMLVGVGGLLGIHRTVAVEALRAGLKAGALGAVLSPPDPQANPAQLVASLAGLFPPAAGRHVFAPTARIVWGSPVLITIDLALVLELPSPVRLVALGRMRALLPEERDPVVRLQVDVLGVIDFDQQTAAVDATLIDSRIAQFALTGDLALRMSWGPTPVFLLAVGGFHPRFAAPPGFPALDRVAVALASGDNPKLRLEAYLALTSNTVQFGARVDVGARAGSFSIGGFMAFDALVTLSPLAFEIDIAAKLAVKAGTHTLLSISLALTLSGPRPWHVHGRASFSILFFDVSFGFDVTIGDPAPAALPNPVDVAPLLLAALADPRAWTAQLPAGADVVTLRTLESGQAILAHPLATLQVRQRVAPLDRTLDRFGTSAPSGAKRFRITLATVGGVRATLVPLQDRFAPAQFTTMSDDQKLSAPSFEAMTSGAALGADGYTTGAPVTVSVTYEQALVTAEGIAPPSHQRLPLPLDVFATLTATTSVPAPAFALRDAA